MGVDEVDAGGGGEAPTRVFLSYRRTDDVNFVGRFHDRLVEAFGEENVFRDVDSLHPGDEFGRVIREHISTVDALVALIGRTWVERLKAPDDFVRMELAEALAARRPVIPILIEDTTLPRPDELPEELLPLLGLNVLRVRRDPDFRRDSARALDGIRRAVREERRRVLADQRNRDEAQAAEERRAAELAAKELAARLAAAEQLEQQRRRQAEALAAERKQREAELAAAEADRRLADERARLDEIVNEQRQVDAELAQAQKDAEKARAQLAGSLTPPPSNIPTPPPSAPLGARSLEQESTQRTRPAADRNVARTLVVALSTLAVVAAGVIAVVVFRDDLPGGSGGDATETTIEARIGPEPPGSVSAVETASAVDTSDLAVEILSVETTAGVDTTAQLETTHTASSNPAQVNATQTDTAQNTTHEPEEAATGQIGPILNHDNSVLSVAWAQDGGRIVSGTSDAVWVWNAVSGAAVGSPFVTGGGGVNDAGPRWAMALAPDGSRIAVGISYSPTTENSVKVLDAVTGATVGVPFTDLDGATYAVTWSPDGTKIASGGHDTTVHVWDAATGATIHELTGHTEAVEGVAWSPDSSKIVSGGYEGTVRVWDAATGATIHELTGHTLGVASVAWSPDSSKIVSGGRDGTMRVWDAATGATIAESTSEHTDVVRGVAWSPDGSMIASGSHDTTVRVWDAASLVPIGEPFTGHLGMVMAVAWSPNSTEIASASFDSTVRVWDVETRRTK